MLHILPGRAKADNIEITGLLKSCSLASRIIEVLDSSFEICLN
jgi:hypothetical protein